MARIKPIRSELVEEPLNRSLRQQVEQFNNRIANLKATLGHQSCLFSGMVLVANKEQIGTKQEPRGPKACRALHQ
jgi:hypothetical protein